MEQASFSDKQYTMRLEDTSLEQTTESILNEIGFETGQFEKQYIPSGTKYRIDFAFPPIRLAIEPHASYLWGVNDGREEQKEAELNSRGWDVLWLDETDLENKEEAEQEIREAIIRTIDNIKVQDEDSVIVQKENTSGTDSSTYDLPEDDAQLVVIDGRVLTMSMVNHYRTVDELAR
ncbi:hypothetical protein [Haloplanus natans]|uniref:hypothetical protein n=1 Tax=Haloplanus natans TaxID=376171 RepID=UPI0012FC132A|nr:hypothetical protein [Haloplanus natans]